MNILRFFLAALGFLGAIFFPPWIPGLSIIALSLRFRAWEVPLIGLVIDLLWRPLHGIEVLPLFTIGAIVIVWGLEPLRKEFLAT